MNIGVSPRVPVHNSATAGTSDATCISSFAPRTDDVPLSSWARLEFQLCLELSPFYITFSFGSHCIFVSLGSPRFRITGCLMLRWWFWVQISLRLQFTTFRPSPPFYLQRLQLGVTYHVPAPRSICTADVREQFSIIG